jgi:glycosyltransferase involved in cell wall biosynthesis
MLAPDKLNTELRVRPQGHNTVAAVVMTANEEANIGKCLESLKDFNRVYVLDSDSSDMTLEIVGKFPNALVVPTRWRGYAKTFNGGVDLAKDYDWVLRIDADEELHGDIKAALAHADASVSGFVLRRDIYFLGQRLRFGPHSKLKMVRLFRQSLGRCEETLADEHIIVNGAITFSNTLKIIDRDNKPFDRWLEKHIRWAKKEAANMRAPTQAPGEIDRYNRLKRFMKRNVYYGCPPFVRAFLYFFYRFFICLEFLGGRSGISWCVIQGLWYRLLVDFYLLNPKLINTDQ